jgi:leucyl/phenylalanyl-tRNA--protein transferase
MRRPQTPVPWLDAGEAFPPLQSAWGEHDPAPGLLAAGGALDVQTLVRAYGQGIFPWFSPGQPILWWSPDPRMALQTADFKLHRSLKKTLRRFLVEPGCSLRFDTAFDRVIQACADTPREGQPGTWIVPEMIAAYSELHRAGHAHSVETWVNGELAGGLYCVNLGGMVFGESMFAHHTDASKIALAGLVSFCKAKGLPLIDCQQNTGHLASLGAAEMTRADFAARVNFQTQLARPQWLFDDLYWQTILTPLP